MGQFPKSLMEFQSVFATDQDCEDYLLARRWPDGFTCPKCGRQGEARLLKRRAGRKLRVWECRGCRRQTTAVAGTVMENTKLPLRTWFWGAWLMASHSNGISALQLKNQLGVAYGTAWLMEAKFRRSMIAQGRSKLSGLVEIDQTEMPFRESDPPLGVGAEDGKIRVIGAVEVVDRMTRQTPTWRYGATLHGTAAGRVRLQVIPDQKAQTLEAFVTANVAPGSIVITDGHQSYLALPSLGYRHDPRTVKNVPAHLVLPWVHRIFALMKRWGMGTFHGLRRKHVQTYLDEFVFRFNRRGNRKQTFERLLGLAATRPPAPYHAITGTAPRDWKADRLRWQSKIADRIHAAKILAEQPLLEGPKSDTSG